MGVDDERDAAQPRHGPSDEARGDDHVGFDAVHPAHGTEGVREQHEIQEWPGGVHPSRLHDAHAALPSNTVTNE
jgi:hypothetical protein